MSARVLRLGIVGCGRLAEFGYLPALAGLDGLTLVAVADPDPARRAHVGRLAGAQASVQGFSGARAMVEGSHLDVAVVASPVGAHLDDARALAGARVTTLVEKPPAPDGAATRALAAMDPAPWVGFNRRFDAGARRLRDVVPPSGDLDLDVAIHYRRSSWRAHAVHDDALLDLGPHLVDWATWVSRSAVTAVGDATIERDRAACTLTLARGRARIVAECDRPHREVIDVRDSTGARVGRHTVGGIGAGLRARVVRGPHPLVASIAAQLSALAEAARGGTTGSLATADEAASVMAVIDAARISGAERGRTVPVAAVQDA
jgi:predicted dehydrogenase